MVVEAIDPEPQAALQIGQHPAVDAAVADGVLLGQGQETVQIDHRLQSEDLVGAVLLQGVDHAARRQVLHQRVAG